MAHRRNTFIQVGDRKFPAVVCKICPGHLKVTNIEDHNRVLHSLVAPGCVDTCIVCGETFTVITEYNTHKCQKCLKRERSFVSGWTHGMKRPRKTGGAAAQFKEGIQWSETKKNTK
jgi:DNA-directed RNA polymerase subunit RPC12/RpoP